MSEADLSIKDLGGYLESQIDGFHGLKEIVKFAGGQSNPTYRLSATSGEYVLRRKPFGKLLQSAHAVDREFRVMRALANTEVPVPRMLHLCEDQSVCGAQFFVMEYVRSRHFWDPSLPELDNVGRSAIYDEMNRILAALHSVDVEKAGLGDFGRPGNYYERQTARWTKQYRASETGSVAAMDRLIQWLPENMPRDDGRSCLIHGDYRLDNILFAPERDVGVALLDWELSTLGHPFADLAYQCMQLRMATDAVLKGLAGVDRPALGIPTEAQYVARYCRRMGIAGIPDWTFYLAFSCFRFAAILQGILKRAIDGTASSELAFEYGKNVAPLAEMAVDIIAADGG